MGVSEISVPNLITRRHIQQDHGIHADRRRPHHHLSLGLEVPVTGKELTNGFPADFDLVAGLWSWRPFKFLSVTASGT